MRAGQLRSLNNLLTSSMVQFPLIAFSGGDLLDGWISLIFKRMTGPHTKTPDGRCFFCGRGAENAGIFHIAQLDMRVREPVRAFSSERPDKVKATIVVPVILCLDRTNHRGPPH